MDHESAEERDVDLVDEAYRYLTDKTYPNGTAENRKRAITVLTVSVPARARDSWRRLYRQEHGEQLHNAILDLLLRMRAEG